MHNDMQSLVKKVSDLNNIVENTNRILKEMVGIILVLKQKGMVFDDEIAQAIIDASKANSKKVSIQPEGAGDNEINIGHG